MSNLTYYPVLLFFFLLCVPGFSQAIHWDKEGDIFSAEKKVLKHPLNIPLNQEFDHTQALVSPGGNFLFFSIAKHSQNIGSENLEDIWVSYPGAQGQWSRPVNIGAPVNNRKANQIVGISGSEDRIYITENYQTISYAEKKGRLWSKPISMTLNGAISWKDVVDMHVGAEGKILLLAAKNTEGNFDLFFARRSGPTAWGAMQSLGPSVNTPLDEKSITLAYDGKTIYFSSNGHNGVGNQDVYRSQRLGNSWTNWSAPENLGIGLNTENDELAFSVTASGKEAFLCLQTEGNMQLCQLSLPEHLRPEPVTLIKGRILGESLPAEAQLQLEALGVPDRRKTISVNPDGSFQTIVPYGANISLSANAEGYFSWSDNLELSETSLEELDFDAGATTASLSNDPVYVKRNAEIQSLQHQLEGLNAELESIKEVRLAYQKRLADERAAFLASGGVLPKSSDPELDQLLHQYNAYIYNYEDALTFSEEEEVVEYLNDTIIPQKKPEPQTSSTSATADDELEELKRRFKAYHKQKEEDEKLENSGADTLLWERPMSYEDFGTESFPITGVKGVAPSLVTEARKELEEESEDPQTKALLLAEEERLKAQIAAGLNGNPEPSALTPKTPEPKADWEQQLSQESVEPLDPPVSEWEQSLKSDIKDALKTELNYQVKQAVATSLKEKLDEKIQEQIQTEQAAGYAAYGNPKEQLAEPTNTTPKSVGFQEIEKDILLSPIEVGQTITLNNIFFNPNTAILKPVSDNELTRLYSLLNDHPTLVVEIGAHTNGWTSHSFATQLSNQRAQAIVNLLEERGIAAGRLQAKGYGKTTPIATNDTLEGRKLNQRIELKILATH